MDGKVHEPVVVRPSCSRCVLVRDCRLCATFYSYAPIPRGSLIEYWFLRRMGKCGQGCGTLPVQVVSEGGWGGELTIGGRVEIVTGHGVRCSVHWFSGYLSL